MNRSEKFKNFLESLKDGQHDSLIENIWSGFSAINEAEMKSNGANGSTWTQPVDEDETQSTDEVNVSEWDQPNDEKVSQETNADTKWEQP